MENEAGEQTVKKHGSADTRAPDRIPQEKGQRGGVLEALGWLWFVMCLPYVAIAARTGAIGAAPLYLISGLMSLPPVWRWLVQRGLKISIRSRSMIGVVSVIAAAILFAPHLPIPSTQSSDAPATTIASLVNSDNPRPQTRQSKVAAPSTPTPDAKAKIAELIADERGLPRANYEDRLLFWREIVRLDPANVEYAAEQQALDEKVTSLAYTKEHPEEGLIVERVRGHKAGFGMVLTIDITLRNDSLSDLKDPTISCRGHGHSGTEIGDNVVALYEVIKARTSRTFRNVNMGFIATQTANISCTVAGASVA